MYITTQLVVLIPAPIRLKKLKSFYCLVMVGVKRLKTLSKDPPENRLVFVKVGSGPFFEKNKTNHLG